MAPRYSDAAWRRLGAAVRRERRRLGHADTTRWAALVGRSSRLVLGLERGEPVGADTLERIDDVLGWGTGHAFELLEGAAEPPPVAEAARVESPDPTVRVVVAVLDALPGPMDPEALDEIQRAVDRHKELRRQGK